MFKAHKINYKKTLMKEFRKANECRDIAWLWIAEMIFSELMYRFSISPLKTKEYFIELNKMIPKLFWKNKSAELSNITLWGKEEQWGGTIFARY